MWAKTKESTSHSKAVFNLKLISFVTILFLGFTIACSQVGEVPKMLDGYVNAEEFFETEGKVLKLSGEWIYFPNMLLSPLEITEIQKNRPNSKFYVPGVWSKSFYDYGFLSGDGYATFQTNINHGLTNQPLSLLIPEMETAYVLFVDGKKIAQNGVVSFNEQKAVPEYKPQIVDFIPQEKESTIVLQISNYHHRKGGPGQIISLARTSDIHAKYESELMKDMLLVGSILFMGIYHGFLYLNRRKAPQTFWFALTCFLIFIRVFVTGNKYITLIYPNIPWELHLKLSYLSFFLIPPFFGRYIYLLFKPYFSKSIYELIIYASYMFSLIVLVTKTSFYTYLMVPFQVFCVFAAIYVFYTTYRVIIAKVSGSKIFLFSFVLFIFSFVNDILVNNLIIHGPLMIHFGIFTMFFFQAILIAKGFSTGFEEAENLAIELSSKNQELQQVKHQLIDTNESLEIRVKEKTNLLQNKLDQIGKDLQLAKSIVQNLTKPPDLNPHLKLDILYQPIAEVGGDIYFIKKIQDFYYRFFLADATGHGLQAALYTMMIQSEFERITDVAMRPNDLLFYINRHFYEKNAELQIYFPAIALDFDFQQGILRYAGAGVTNQILLRTNGNTEYLENSGPIIGILEHYRFTIYETSVKKGDRIFLYTDGLFEELNEADGVSALSEFVGILQRTSKLSFEEVLPFVKKELFDRMKKNVWKDDSTILFLEVNI